MLKLVYTTNVVVTPERGILAPLAKWINSLACCIQRITDLKAARRRLRVSRFHVCFEKSNVITNNLWQLVVRWVRSQNGTKVSPKFCNRNHSSLLMRKEVLPRIYHLLLGCNRNCRGCVAGRDQSHALRLSFNPGRQTGALAGRQFRFEKLTLSLKDPRADVSERRGPGLPGARGRAAPG